MNLLIKKEIEMCNKESMILEKYKEMERNVFLSIIRNVEGSCNQTISFFHSDNFWNLNKKATAFFEAARNDESLFENYCRFPNVFWGEFEMKARNHLEL